MKWTRQWELEKIFLLFNKKDMSCVERDWECVYMYIRKYDDNECDTFCSTMWEKLKRKNNNNVKKRKLKTGGENKISFFMFSNFSFYSVTKGTIFFCIIFIYNDLLVEYHKMCRKECTERMKTRGEWRSVCDEGFICNDRRRYDGLIKKDNNLKCWKIHYHAVIIYRVKMSCFRLNLFTFLYDFRINKCFFFSKKLFWFFSTIGKVFKWKRKPKLTAERRNRRKRKTFPW